MLPIFMSVCNGSNPHGKLGWKADSKLHATEAFQRRGTISPMTDALAFWFGISSTPNNRRKKRHEDPHKITSNQSICLLCYYVNLS